MNSLDKQYIDLLKDIVENGTKKMDRTGTGTISVFGRAIRHKMSEGFPLLTSKKMYTKGIIAELLWFLRGETNIRPLVLAGCNIWNGDAYKNFDKNCPANGRKMSREEFDFCIAQDEDFAKVWGELGSIYGKQWRSWSNYRTSELYTGYPETEKTFKIKGIDQIQNLINDLKKNPDSRRLMVNAWNVSDLPVTDYRTDDELYQDYLKNFE